MKEETIVKILLLIFILFLCIVIGLRGKKYSPSKAYSSTVLDMSKAVIHHTAGSDVPVGVINIQHKARGWDGIGYHFLIRKNGTIEEGRSLNKVGAHALGRNNYIGIALTGNNSFTTEQKKSLVWLLRKMKVKHIERHHEKCPGNSLDLDKIRKKL